MAYNLLKGKRGVVFGALNNMSIAWKVAERCHEEGASIVLSNTEMALRMGELNELSEKINAPIIAADATNYEDLENVFSKAQELLGVARVSLGLGNTDEDIDIKEIDSKIQINKLPLIPCRSKSGGVHVNLFLDKQNGRAHD